MSQGETKTKQIRLLVVQFSGDYREAYQRLSRGGEETYYAQRSSVDLLGEIGREIEQAGVLCCCSDEWYDEVVGNGVRAMGAMCRGDIDPQRVIGMIKSFQPTHLILCTPNLAILNWALGQGLSVLPLLADSFLIDTSGLALPRKLYRTWRKRRYYRRLAEALNRPELRWVGNHNIPACHNLAGLGVRPEKILPYDWPPTNRPEMYRTKQIPENHAPWNLVFVGAVCESKGVGDAIDAVAELKRRGREAELTIIGKAEGLTFQRRAEALEVADRVRFEGRQPQSRVIAAMRSADLVIVPSRHGYPEGLPLVIYEALAVRTPLVCSDHPAFRGRIGHGESSLVFPERNAVALADQVERIMSDPLLYAAMSEATAATWERLQCPLKYADLIRGWLFKSAESERWLAENTLANLKAGLEVASAKRAKVSDQPRRQSGREPLVAPE